MWERIALVALVILLVVGFIWFRNDRRAPVGDCVQLQGTDQDIPVYYRESEGSFRVYSSPECTEQSRITI